MYFAAGGLIMNDVADFLEKKYKEEQYNHPIQTRPKPKPGITNEEPDEIKANDFGDEGGTTSLSSKRVNKSKNREFEDQDEADKEEE
jgi:hypothetical protein